MWEVKKVDESNSNDIIVVTCNELETLINVVNDRRTIEHNPAGIYISRSKY